MTTIAADLPQHMRALQHAETVRLQRARLLADLRAGTLTLADVLDDPAVQSMNTGCLLAKQHRWGAVRARRVLRQAGVSEYRSVRDLTARQRDALLLQLAANPQETTR